MQDPKEYYSIAEVAKLIGLSRIAVYNRVKAKTLVAKRFGRSYYIPADVVATLVGRSLSEEVKKQISQAVQKTVREYGDTLRLLEHA